MFINIDRVIPIIESYRIVHVSGKFGGCKSSFCTAIYEKYWGPKGYRFISNMRCVFNDDTTLKLDEENHAHTVVVLDEGGRYLKANYQVENIMSLAAKMDIILLIPSYWPPCRAATQVTIQAAFSIRSTGIPLIVYNWFVHMGSFKDKGTFLWLFPELAYGLYSRQDPGDTATEIIEILSGWTEDYRKRYGRNIIPEVEEDVLQSQLFSDAVGALSEAADSWSSISVRKNFKRR